MNLKSTYTASGNRYAAGDAMYARCGRSGVLLPRISLGLWQNFGYDTTYEKSRAITHYAFDNGITHFDLANNYGPPYGAAEEVFGRLMRDDFAPYRDELFISTKAGYDMWPGPYGNWGSRKYLFASLDQSLRRMSLDYVDLFYIHRYDPVTPLEETLQALVDIVRIDRDISKGTGTMLSPTDRLLGDKFNDDIVLTMYRLVGSVDKGWEGKPLWMPNIKFPDGICFYNTLE